jgi:hypothetical protein
LQKEKLEDIGAFGSNIMMFEKWLCFFLRGKWHLAATP